MKDVKKIILSMKRSTVSAASERLNKNGKFSIEHSNRGEAGGFNKLLEKKPGQNGLKCNWKMWEWKQSVV